MLDFFGMSGIASIILKRLKSAGVIALALSLAIMGGCQASDGDSEMAASAPDTSFTSNETSSETLDSSSTQETVETEDKSFHDEQEELDTKEPESTSEPEKLDRPSVPATDSDIIQTVKNVLQDYGIEDGYTFDVQEGPDGYIIDLQIPISLGPSLGEIHAKLFDRVISGTRIEISQMTTMPGSRSSGGSKGGGSSRTVYWTAGGGSYHYSQNCVTLKRSKIVSGTLSEAIALGKDDPCNVCAGG